MYSGVIGTLGTDLYLAARKWGHFNFRQRIPFLCGGIVASRTLGYIAYKLMYCREQSEDVALTYQIELIKLNGKLLDHVDLDYAEALGEQETPTKFPKHNSNANI